MCGICGVVSAGTKAVPGEALERAVETIRHRGPDHGATLVSGRCGLGYRRLRVVDLATGDQPVENEDGSVIAVFNGELYDFAAVRERLRGAGHELRGTGDTPVIPHLYEEHGDDFVEHLDGMFALALWDARRERLVLARDRFGKKPLLWARTDDGGLAFASELGALLAFPGISARPSLRALDAYLALGYVPGPETAVEGVSWVPPGHRLVAERGEVRLERYWQLEPARAELSDDEWVAAVRDGVREAVRRRLVADVPLGALLSGGIDSSVVVACMAEAAGGPVRTFSVGFEDDRYDERRFARVVAERFDTRHEELVVDLDAAALLPRLADAWHLPLGDPSALPTFVVCEHTRRAVTVALTGDGGDEVFGGYERYRAMRLADSVGRLRGGAAVTGRLLRRLPGGRTEPRSAAFRGARFLETAALPAANRYAAIMELLPVSLRAELWSDEALASLGRPSAAAELLGPPPASGITGLQLLDAATYLPDDLLLKADVASMANSLELRSPLLDASLASLALALPDRLKASPRQGKVALRRAFADVLPDEILARGKKGFGVPVSRWFRGELAGLAGDVLLDGTAGARDLFRPAAVEALLSDHKAGRADHGARLWALVMLELWQRAHVDAAGSAGAPISAAGRAA